MLSTKYANTGAAVAGVGGAQKLERLAADLMHAKTLRLLSAVAGSSAFAGCLMAGKDAYGHVRSVVELRCEMCKLAFV